MELFDNITKTVKDDLKITLAKGSRLSIAVACFSIYAYSQLKKQLDSIEEPNLYLHHRLLLQRKRLKRSANFISHALIVNVVCMVRNLK